MLPALHRKLWKPNVNGVFLRYTSDSSRSMEPANMYCQKAQSWDSVLQHSRLEVRRKGRECRRKDGKQMETISIHHPFPPLRLRYEWHLKRPLQPRSFSRSCETVQLYFQNPGEISFPPLTSGFPQGTAQLPELCARDFLFILNSLSKNNNTGAHKKCISITDFLRRQ